MPTESPSRLLCSAHETTPNGSTVVSELALRPGFSPQARMPPTRVVRQQPGPITGRSNVGSRPAGDSLRSARQPVAGDVASSATTCSQPCAETCSRSSAATTRRGRSSTAPPRSPKTPASAQCCSSRWRPPRPGTAAEQKEAFDAELSEPVCRGRASLAFAQRLIATDWIAAGQWVHDHFPGVFWRGR
jgi:hypothetical protein